MPFVLPKLPFDREALAPWTSAETLDYHHGKHHAGYVKKLNVALEGSGMEDQSLEKIISSTRNNLAIFNSAAQHWNHSFFWNCLSPDVSKPKGNIVQMIDRDFGSFELFKEAFSQSALKLFGSGWAWLVKTDHQNGELNIVQYKDADTPLGTKNTPLLTLDVWEHAYYIDYRNDREKFIEGFWNHVNWEFVEKQLT